MKQTLLKTMAFVLTLLGGVNVAWADDVTETVTAAMDGWARMDNSAVNYDVAANSHLEIKYETDKNNYGLLCFEVPAKSGYKVKSAVLRFVSKKISGNRQTNIYKLSTDISSKPAFANLAISDALASTAIGTFSAEGQSGRQVSSDSITTDKYTTIAIWQNSITLDASAVTVGEKLNLLIAISTENQNSNSNSNRFFGKNAEGFTNNKLRNNATLTCTSDELVPKLTVTYEEDSDYKTVTVTSTADGYVRDNSSQNGTDTYFPVKKYTPNGGTNIWMYGYMTFALEEQEGYDLQSATLRLTAKRAKGDRYVNIYPLAGTTTESVTYSDLEATIGNPGTAIISDVKMEGGNFDLTSNSVTEEYRNLSKWQTTIDLTNHVKSLSTQNFGLLFERKSTATNEEIHIFTREAAAFTNNSDEASTTFTSALTADDLRPQLVLVYKKSDNSTPTSLLTQDNDKTVDGTADSTVVYNVNNTENTVKIIITKTADYDGAPVHTHGTVTATAAKDANDKTIVTLTVTPENDKHAIDGTPVVEMVASDSQSDQPTAQFAPRRSAPTVGSFATVTDNGDGTYSFEMPDASVEVSVKFKRLPDVPVVAPVFDYSDEANNKLTLSFGTGTGTEGTDYRNADKMYYTTDGSDPRSSESRTEVTAQTTITVTADMTVVKAVGVVSQYGDFSDVVEQQVSRASYLNVTKQWVAFCSPNTYSVPEGLKAYTIATVAQPNGGQSGTATLQEQTVINKNTPMLIENTTENLATTRFRITAADDQDISGCAEFKGTLTATSLTAAAGKTFYVLKNGEFLRVANPGAVSAYNCWLEITDGGSNPNNAPRYSIVIGGNTTRIDSIGTATIEGDAAWYTLSGVRVDRPTQKGIYIHNGKKIVVK